MSIETLLAENTAAMTALATVIAAQTAVTERVVAGQAAAMEKLDAAKPAGTRAPRGSKKDEAPAAGNAESVAPAATETQAGDAASASDLPKDLAGVKAFVGAWTGSTDDAAVRAERVGFLKSLAGYFFPDGSQVGTAALAASADNIKQSVFFIERKKAGLDVDFGVPYDFDGAPDQAVAAEEAGGGDDFD